MEKKENSIIKISSISQLHSLLQLPGPPHPLVSLIDNAKMRIEEDWTGKSFMFNFYKISYKYSTNGKMGYGQGYYDFNEGGMMFTAPGQVLSPEEDSEYCG